MRSRKNRKRKEPILINGLTRSERIIKYWGDHFNVRSKASANERWYEIERRVKNENKRAKRRKNIDNKLVKQLYG